MAGDDGRSRDNGEDLVHPLNSTWSIWENYAEGDYQTSMHNLCDFSTIEEFWACFNNLPKSSDILSGGKKFSNRELKAYAIFKENIVPAWEDPVHKSVCVWKCQDFDNKDADRYWRDLVLGMIGESIDEGNGVTGGRIVRKGLGGASRLRLELWVTEKDAAKLGKLRENLKKVMGSNLKWLE